MNKAVKKKSKKKQRLSLLYFLLIFIAMMLLLIVSYLNRDQFKAPPTLSIENNIPLKRADDSLQGHPLKVNKSLSTDVDKDQSKPLVAKKSVEILDSDKKQSDPHDKEVIKKVEQNHSLLNNDNLNRKKPPILYIVLDDIGNNINQLYPFIKLPMKITYAIMPQRPFSRKAAGLIHSNGGEIIIHQPMEPLGNADPGKGAIFTWMQKDDIVNELMIGRSTLAYAVGMNNHMGSKATADQFVMTAVFQYLRGQDMFFLDSKTTAKVVGPQLKQLLDGKYLQRNAMFLDNDKDKQSIQNAIRTGMRTAEHNGHAVMIGHVMTSELAEALLDMYPEILDEGYEFDHLSEYFTGDDE